MKTGYFKKFATTALLTPALLLATLPAAAQSWSQPNQRDNRGQVQQQNNRRDNDRRDLDNRNNDRRDNRDNDRIRSYQGRDYRGYDRDGYRPAGYVAYTPAYTGDNGYYVQDNGIGPGKGAAIGAVSGAVLGALFGGGKGALIGGAAGAGIGAVAGQAAQNNRYSRY